MKFICLYISEYQTLMINLNEVRLFTIMRGNYFRMFLNSGAIYKVEVPVTEMSIQAILSFFNGTNIVQEHFWSGELEEYPKEKIGDS